MSENTETANSQIKAENKQAQKQQQKQQKKKEKKEKAPTTAQNDKKNTDAWKEKQAQKKKQKQQKQKQMQQAGTNPAPEGKQDKKQKKKKQKDAPQNKSKQQQKEQPQKNTKDNKDIKDNKDKKDIKATKEGKEGKDAKDTKQKKQDNKKQKQSNKKQQKKQASKVGKVSPVPEQKKHKKLQTVQSLIVPKHPLLLDTRGSKIELMKKQILNLIRPNDTILHLGKLVIRSKQKISGGENRNQLLPGCGKNNYRLVEIPGYYHGDPADSQIVCRYQDVSYLVSEEIDKIFVEAQVIFQNGSALVAKGYENIVTLANYYNKPVVLVCGSWNYTRISISSYEQLQSIYGQELSNKYDWICNDCINLVCMEFGNMLASQVGYQVEQGYRNFGILTQEW